MYKSLVLEQDKHFLFNFQVLERVFLSRNKQTWQDRCSNRGETSNSLVRDIFVSVIMMGSQEPVKI